MILEPALDQDAPRLLAGAVGQLAASLHTELVNSGYSLMPEDVLLCVVQAVCKYAAWDTLDAQRNATGSVSVDSSLVLAAHEWQIIEPLVRAHCDLIQANRMEASRSLGMEQVGMSVSEAMQGLQMQQDLLAQRAFCAPPFAIEIDP